MELVLPLLAFGAFLVIFAVQARREGRSTREWLAARNARMRYVPDWWKPAGMWIAALVAAFIVYLTIDQGFRWAYLLLVVIFALFFAGSVAVLSWLFKRQFRE